jgi:hypothetical protein
LQFVPLELVKSAILANTNLLGSNGEKLLSFAETKKTYESWLDESLLERDMYDLFLSYRWNDDDKELSESLFGIITMGLPIGLSNRSIWVFLDKKRLAKGRNF